jgi:glucose/arabinose dehydrogenase
MRNLSYLSLPLLLVVAGCGDGNSSGPAPTPTPSAPTFTSPAAASFPEAPAFTYQATATDPSGSPLTYSIAGGADAAKFTISSSGALTLNNPPNYDLPTDADANNVYEVQLRVTDGTLASVLDLRLTITNSREGIRVRRIASGLNQPMMLAPIPGDNATMLLIERGGAVYRFTTATGAKTLVTTVSDVTMEGERGLLGIAVQPDFAFTGGFAVYATDSAGTIRIIRYVLNPTTFAVTRSTTLMTIPHPTYTNNYGGWLGFTSGGLLHPVVLVVATGDGGGAGDPAGNAQNPYSRLGKILRFAVGDTGITALPNGPFSGGGGDPYVIGLGLRNPFRATFDGSSLIVGDVGQDQTEEIDKLFPTSGNGSGFNFGWNFKEGTDTFQGTPPAGLTDPLSQYSHGTGPRQGNAIIGGLVYDGPIASLDGSYVFADEVSGNIWTVRATSLTAGLVPSSSSYERRNEDFAPDVGTINSIVDFARGNDGTLYIVDLDGEIFAVEPSQSGL